MDLATVLSLMTDDVVFMVPGQEAFGKEAFTAVASFTELPRGRSRKLEGRRAERSWFAKKCASSQELGRNLF